MSHSHLALQHLISKLDSPQVRRPKSSGPGWLQEFVDQIAELFEPFVDVGRVGYECAPGEERWEVSMYLGSTEVVGGEADGQLRPVAFQFDLSRLTGTLDSVESCYWNAFPAGTLLGNQCRGERSFVSVVGAYRQNAVRLRIFATAPENSTPGLRQYPDGSWEPVS